MNFNGKVYLDKTLKNYVVPKELREMSSSKDGNKYTSGSRISINKKAKYIRLYTAWGTNDGSNKNFDIDLAGVFVRDDGSFEDLGWNTGEVSSSSRSNDITFCRGWDETNVVAEFIDVDIKKARKEFKYIMFSQFIYSTDGLALSYDKDIVAKSGVMMLKDRKRETGENINISNSLWEMTLQGEKSSHIPFLLDLERMEIVVMDIYSKDMKGATIQTFRSKANILKMKYLDAYKTLPNMDELMRMYCESNEIEVVSNIDDCDIIVSEHDYKDKQTFNVGKNLENIMSLLN